MSSNTYEFNDLNTLTPEKWQDMDLEELYQQLHILSNRMEAARSLFHEPHIFISMNTGYEILKNIISIKESEY
jgi:hypothetical protein